MKKQQRLEVIKEVLEHEHIASQKGLMTALKQRGIEVKQSAISRDLKTLNYIKTADQHGNMHYQIVNSVNSKANQLQELMSEVMISVTRVQFMNVVRTLPANGNLLAALIDEQQLPDVLATLAGHDTIYITSPDEAAAVRLNAELIAVINNNIKRS
ncbi:arginine repressor [Periweissella fabalis]|uniref:Arginine repressor n=1 Tax=Periweissella fabalis TaxID=1070421 RepID=A0A7X6N2Q8_9LACO|nr:ArgR family transcriptional regulator [Periweissella fabalis]MCM0598773.1 ArgR family transcriptional regulator [Periweissella fabalis]NKZ24628.1 ArgR family transcriptional regulator [Periweissella fabalis]